MKRFLLLVLVLFMSLVAPVAALSDAERAAYRVEILPCNGEVYPIFLNDEDLVVNESAKEDIPTIDDVDDWRWGLFLPVFFIEGVINALVVAGILVYYVGYGASHVLGRIIDVTTYPDTCREIANACKDINDFSNSIDHPIQPGMNW